MDSYLVYFFSSSIIAYFFFKNFIKWAKIFKLLDKNDKFIVGNKYTPTGSGVVFFIIFLFGSIFFYNTIESFSSLLPNRFYVFYIVLVFLALISLYDDYKLIDPILRLSLQFVLIFFSTVSIPISNIELPFKLTLFLSIVFWIYIINITNFIDGLDGFLTNHSLFFFAGIILVQYLFSLNLFSFYISLLMIPILLVFYFFNKPIAKVYMGDAGSITLGFLIGFSLLELIFQGYYLIAFSLYVYPLIDCSITLIKKISRGHYPWDRLFDYFFLIPVMVGKKNHSFVFRIAFLFNLLNLVAISLQILINKYFFLLSILLAIINICIYSQSSNNTAHVRNKKNH